MVNKILASVQDVQGDIDKYLNYTARLAKDIDVELELVSHVGIINNKTEPVSILGEGLPLPIKLHHKEMDPKSIEKIHNMFSNISKLHHYVSYDINHSSIFDRLGDVKSGESITLVTINQKSENSYFTQMLGAVETDIAKNTQVPTLTIPEGCPYKKPTTVMTIIRDTPDLQLNQLYALSVKMNLRILFVYHEDETELSVKNIVKSVQASFGEFAGTISSFSMDYNGDHLDKMINQEKPEWLAIANYDRTFMERLYKKNTNELILTSELPILNF